MSEITRQAYTNYTLTDKQELSTIVPIFNAYQTSIDPIDVAIYASAYPTNSAIGTGTIANSVTQPIVARKFENNGSIYRYNAGRPATAADTINRVVGVVSANDGRMFTGITFSVNPAGYICLVAKTSASMDLTLKLNTTAGSHSRDIVFDTDEYVADSNGYKRFIAPLDPTAVYIGATVSDTGTFNPASIVSIDISGDTAGTIEWDSLYSAPTVESFIGHQLTMEFDCLDDYTWERTLDTADRKCFNFVTGSTPNNKSVMITLKSNELNLKGQAMALGEIVKSGPVNVPIIQNAAEGGLTKTAISAGTMTIAGLTAARIMSVRIGDTILDRVESATLVNNTSYHYNAATGVFTFSTLYNGNIPTIVYNSQVTTNYVDDRNMKTGYVGNLTVTRKSATGRTLVYIFEATEIVKVTPEQGDAQVSHSYEMKVYPFKDGKDFRYYRQIEF